MLPCAWCCQNSCSCCTGIIACRRTGRHSAFYRVGIKIKRWLQVASPFAGRVHPATRRTVGCCINTLAMRTRLQGLATLGELVAAVRGTALAAYRNAEASLHTVMQAMGRCPEESLFSVRPPRRPAPALDRPHLQAVLHQAHLVPCWKHAL